MILPNTDKPLLDYADQSSVSQSLLLKFIEDGGAKYFEEVFVAYATQYLMDSAFLDGVTPVGAFDKARVIYKAISEDFTEEFKAAAKK